MRNDETGPHDGELVAYIDEAMPPADRSALELRLSTDAALRQRLEWLRRGDRPFREVYDAILSAAPVARLEANLARLMAGSGTDEPAQPVSAANADVPAVVRWRGFVPAAIAASLLLFVLGFGAGHIALGDLPFIHASSEDDDGPEAWRQVVADYLRLTTSQTLSAMRPSDEQLRRDLATALKKVGLSTPPDEFALAGRQLMKVELYHYDNLPIAQITYLDEENGPVSLCITARSDTPAPPGTERRGDMNIAFWSSPSHAFMLVGLAPEQVLGTLAGEIAGRIGA